MSSADEILVVGGGIGGLSTALALAQTGRAVRVLEQAAEFTEIGAGLQLAPNATRVLAGLGLLEPVLTAGVAPERLALYDALDGRELTHLPLADLPQRYGAPYVVLHRSDLLDILLQGCRARGVGLETNKDVVAVDDHPDGVVLHCRDGSLREGILVVGADGLASTVRTLFSDDEPVGSGYVAYRGAIAIDEATRPGRLDEVAAWIGPGLHFVQYALRRGEMYNQVAVFRSPRYQAGHEDWGGPEELAEAFSGTCAHVRAALPALWQDRRWSMHDREPLETWVHDRTVLLGDAAHPMLQYLAQGACQAMQDAAALAEALDTHTSLSAPPAHQLDKALHAYQAARIGQATRVQRAARTWGNIWHVDGLARLLRNEVLIQRRPEDHRHLRWLYAADDEMGDHHE